RSYGDWSSDVCSSDLIPRLNRLLTIANRAAGASVGMSIDITSFNRVIPPELKASVGGCYGLNVKAVLAQVKRFAKNNGLDDQIRSEERRVGKECRARR